MILCKSDIYWSRYEVCMYLKQLILVCFLENLVIFPSEAKSYFQIYQEVRVYIIVKNSHIYPWKNVKLTPLRSRMCHMYEWAYRNIWHILDLFYKGRFDFWGVHFKIMIYFCQLTSRFDKYKCYIWPYSKLRLFLTFKLKILTSRFLKWSVSNSPSGG